MTLGETGQILVTLAAAKQYAAARELGLEEARRELTELLIDARPLSTPPESGAEGWRHRSRAHRVDISAQVSREGKLAIVTHVGIRYYRP